MVKLTSKEKGKKRTFSFEYIKDEEVYGEVKFEVWDNMCNAHLEITKWSHSIAKTLIQDWTLCRLFLFNIGVEETFVSFNEELGDGDVKKWGKFVSLLGFCKPEILYIAKMKLEGD